MSRTYFLTICVFIFQHTGRIFIRCYAFYIYIYNLRNAAYWIAINKTQIEIAKGNFKNTLIQWNIYNVLNCRPHLQSSSVARCRATDEDCRCGRTFWTLYIFHWIKVFLKLPFAISFSVLNIYIYMHIIYIYIHIIYIYILYISKIKIFMNSIYIFIYIYIYNIAVLMITCRFLNQRCC